MNNRPLNCDGKHQWPRQYETRTSAGDGDREIWTCNACLATKVVITTYQPDDKVDRVEQVVEPAPRKP